MGLVNVNAPFATVTQSSVSSVDIWCISTEINKGQLIKPVLNDDEVLSSHEQLSLWCGPFLHVRSPQTEQSSGTKRPQSALYSCVKKVQPIESRSG